MNLNLETLNKELRDKTPDEIIDWALSLSNKRIVSTKQSRKDGGIKMIPNCKGCDEEFGIACLEEKDGNHLATCKDYPQTYPINKGHFAFIIVDDTGKIIMGY